MLITNRSLVTVQILYFLPDYHSIVQEFLYQVEDVRPTYPRIRKFLDFWRTDIQAVIQEIRIADSGAKYISSFNKVDEILRMQ